MRLPGRIAAAIEVLADLEGRHRPASEALKDWGISHRFAGAGDRAAIGNLVYDALRHRSSLAWRMGADTPWHLVIGTVVLAWELDPAALNGAFETDPHAPNSIPQDVVDRLASTSPDDAPDHVQADVPEWIARHFRAAFGERWVEEGRALAGRPPLDLRINTLKAGSEKLASQLGRLGAAPTALSPVGLRIPAVEGQGRHPHVQAEEAFLRGRIEVQDEGSQICALLAGAKPGEQVLDLCAGAGGKTLALAARMENRGQVYAYDSDKNRLAPIYERLKRAGARNVQVRPPGPNALDDLTGSMDRVLVDAPCTGTGVWRRRPDAKWRVTEDALKKRIAEQHDALRLAARFVRPGGTLAYATCSVLPDENADKTAAFLDTHSDFRPVPIAEAWREASIAVAPPSEAILENALLLSPLRTQTDGFFFALMRR